MGREAGYVGAEAKKPPRRPRENPLAEGTKPATTSLERVAGRALPAGELLRLQATAGNAAVTAALTKRTRHAAVQRAAEAANADPLADALRQRTPASIMAVPDFSRATDEERFVLLQAMVRMSWSKAGEESKMVDILTSSGTGLRVLMSRLEAAGLKLKLFNHIDDQANRDRLAGALWGQKYPGIQDDMQDLYATWHTVFANELRQFKADSRQTAPPWGTLPEHARSDLAAGGFGKAWFEGHTEMHRQTVLNLYVKLKGMGFWHYVNGDVSTGDGRLEFMCQNVLQLKKELVARSDFVSPEPSLEDWASREMRTAGQLHFKHFPSAPYAAVQAHVDQAGLLFKNPKTMAVLAPGPSLVQAARHGVSYLCDDYRDVFEIRDRLLGQGWDPASLMGTSGPVPKERA